MSQDAADDCVNIEIEASAEPNTNEDSVPTPNGEPDCASQRGAAKLAQPSEEETIKTQEASAPCDARQMEAKDNTMPPHHEDKAKISEGHAKKKDVANKRKRADTKGDAKEKGSSSEEVAPQSRFKGVYYVLGGRWESKITFQSKTRHIGTYDTEIQAALAFDAKAHELGVPHRSNFLYDCDGNVLSTDMVEPFRGARCDRIYHVTTCQQVYAELVSTSRASFSALNLRGTGDKWRAVGAAPDGQSVNLGTFDSRREAMEECNRWAAETARKRAMTTRIEDPFAYRHRSNNGWNPMPSMVPYESYFPVARRHGNSAMRNAQYPPRVFMPAWPQTAVFQSGEEDVAHATADEWAGAPSYPPYSGQQDPRQHGGGSPIKKRHAFQGYGRSQLYPPAPLRSTVQGATPAGRSNPTRRGPAMPAPEIDECAMPEPHPYWEGNMGSESEYYHPQQLMHRRVVPPGMPECGRIHMYHHPSRGPYQPQPLYEALAPAPHDIENDKFAKDARVKDRENTSKQPVVSQRHVLNGPTFFGVGERETTGSKSNERVEYY